MTMDSDEEDQDAGNVVPLEAIGFNTNDSRDDNTKMYLEIEESCDGEYLCRWIIENTNGWISENINRLTTLLLGFPNGGHDIDLTAIFRLLRGETPFQCIQLHGMINAETTRQFMLAVSQNEGSLQSIKLSCLELPIADLATFLGSSKTPPSLYLHRNSYLGWTDVDSMLVLENAVAANRFINRLTLDLDDQCSLAQTLFGLPRLRNLTIDFDYVETQLDMEAHVFAVEQLLENSKILNRVEIKFFPFSDQHFAGRLQRALVANRSIASLSFQTRDNGFDNISGEIFFGPLLQNNHRIKSLRIVNWGSNNLSFLDSLRIFIGPQSPLQELTIRLKSEMISDATLLMKALDTKKNLAIHFEVVVIESIDDYNALICGIPKIDNLTSLRICIEPEDETTACRCSRDQLIEVLQPQLGLKVVNFTNQFEFFDDTRQSRSRLQHILNRNVNLPHFLANPNRVPRCTWATILKEVNGCREGHATIHSFVVMLVATDYFVELAATRAPTSLPTAVAGVETTNKSLAVFSRPLSSANEPTRKKQN